MASVANETQNRPRYEGIPDNLPITLSGYPDMRHNVCKFWVQEQVEMAARTRVIPSWVPRNPDGTLDETETSARPFLPVQKELQKPNSWFNCFGLCSVPTLPQPQQPTQRQGQVLFNGRSQNNPNERWFSSGNDRVVRHEPERPATIIYQPPPQPQQPPIVLQPVYVAPVQPPAPQTQSRPIRSSPPQTQPERPPSPAPIVIVQNYPPPSAPAETHHAPPNDQHLNSEQVPSNVPETRKRLPDMRTTTGKEWVKSEARRLGRNYPNWLPKNTDGSPDMREPAARVYVEELQTIQNATPMDANAYWRQTQSSPRQAQAVREPPRTSSGLPDVRTIDGRAWVRNQAQINGRAVPSWVPRRTDGSVDTSKPVARIYMEEAGLL